MHDLLVFQGLRGTQSNDRFAAFQDVKTLGQALFSTPLQFPFEDMERGDDIVQGAGSEWLALEDRPGRPWAEKTHQLTSILPWHRVINSS